MNNSDLSLSKNAGAGGDDGEMLTMAGRERNVWMATVREIEATGNRDS